MIHDIRIPEGRDRLPVWARYQVTELLSEVERLRSVMPGRPNLEASEAIATVGLSVHHKVQIPLGRRVQVDWYNNWNVKYSKDDGGLVVTTYDGGMLIHPLISNQVVIRTINAGIQPG